jgi:membrane protein required for colicin V production
MNFLDILIVIPVLWGGYNGFRKGLIIEVFTLLAFGLGIWGGIHFSDWVSVLLTDAGAGGKYLPVIAFTLTFAAVGAMVFFVGKAVQKMVKVVALKPIDKAGGAFFGAAKFLMIVSVALVLFDSIQERDEVLPPDMRENSLLYQPVKDVSIELIPALKYSELAVPVVQEGMKNDAVRDSIMGR